jgi:hypothetical protein
VIGTTLAASLFAFAAEALAFSAPAGWVRTDIDATHRAIAPHVRTVEAWAPDEPGKSKDVLYYAVGDGGIALDAYTAETKATLPAGAAVSEDKALTLCDGQAGRYIAFSTPTLAVEEVIAVAGDFAAAARYERTAGSGEDPQARASVQGLCPQAETPPSD